MSREFALRVRPWKCPPSRRSLSAQEFLLLRARDDHSVMADAVQAQQRNLYQTKFAHLEYRDGLGNSYNEQLRQQSWPVVDDVPPQAQPSASAQVSSSSSGGGSTGSSRW